MENTQPELTVIVPVYNVEKYLHKCINSILAQSYKDFELILVNDGSADKSGEICDYYAQKDKRIKVIHQRNRGVSAARNEGLREAKGNYISFLDSDDYIEEIMFESLMNIIKEKKTDVAICGMDIVTEDGDTIDSHRIVGGRYSQVELVRQLFLSPNPLGSGCCNKIFRWNYPIYFDENVTFAEDWLYLFELLKRCQSGILIPDVLYHYVEQRNSITHRNTIETCLGIIKSTELLRRKTKFYSKEIYRAATEKYLDNCVRYGKQIYIELKRQRTKGYKIRYTLKIKMWTTLLECSCLRLIPLKRVIMYLYLSLRL